VETEFDLRLILQIEIWGIHVFLVLIYTKNCGLSGLFLDRKMTQIEDFVGEEY
jgi:hypothetical protein